MSFAEVMADLQGIAALPCDTALTVPVWDEAEQAFRHVTADDSMTRLEADLFMNQFGDMTEAAELARKLNEKHQSLFPVTIGTPGYYAMLAS